MVAVTDDPKRVKEAAKLLQHTEEFFDALGGYEKYADRVKALVTLSEAFEGIDVKKTLEELDRLKAGQETLTKQIRTSKHGLYVSGIEDYADRFNALAYSVGVATRNFSRCKEEKAIVDAVYEKHGEKIAELKASHAAGDDVSAGGFIPDQVIPDIIGPVYTNSAFIALEGEGETRVTVVDGLSGGRVTIPKFDGGLIAYWIGEQGEYLESLAKVGNVSMSPKKLGALIKLTDTMIKLQSYGLDSLLRRDAVRALAKLLDWSLAFSRGGEHSMAGIPYLGGNKLKYFSASQFLVSQGTPGTTYVYEGLDAARAGDFDGAAVSWDMFDEMEAILEEDDIEETSSSAIVSSPRLFRKLRRQRSSAWDGQLDTAADAAFAPYMAGGFPLTDAALSSLIGPFGKTTQIKSILNAGGGGTTPDTEIVPAASSTNDGTCTVAFKGNLSEVMVGRWFGLEVVEDRGLGLGFLKDDHLIKWRMYFDSAMRQERAVVIAPDLKVR